MTQRGQQALPEVRLSFSTLNATKRMWCFDRFSCCGAGFDGLKLESKAGIDGKNIDRHRHFRSGVGEDTLKSQVARLLMFLSSETVQKLFNQLARYV